MERLKCLLTSLLESGGRRRVLYLFFFRATSTPHALDRQDTVQHSPLRRFVNHHEMTIPSALCTVKRCICKYLSELSGSAISERRSWGHESLESLVGTVDCWVQRGCSARLVPEAFSGFDLCFVSCRCARAPEYDDWKARGLGLLFNIEAVKRSRKLHDHGNAL